MSRREKTPFRMEPFRVDDELHRSIRVENREDAASTVRWKRRCCWTLPSSGGS